MVISGCAPKQPSGITIPLSPTSLSEDQQGQITPIPTRPLYSPGEEVDYIVQTGDNLPALASHFNTTIEEIRKSNPFLPEDFNHSTPRNAYENSNLLCSIMGIKISNHS